MDIKQQFCRLSQKIGRSLLQKITISIFLYFSYSNLLQHYRHFGNSKRGFRRLFWNSTTRKNSGAKRHKQKSPDDTQFVCSADAYCIS